ncbi:carbonic anhydrase family protein [Ideonella sp. B7]|uniref:carbonic anhydrase n=1 Tax=Ideonella benzenivorans TaxID=2831643 RepID=UPI001CECD529|nr:carbonic anhydrase family protein [Ideonella benzenivorans]MCA6217011.1 carbonic anhydrase family protein [Ideonella benzenivorans]
MRPSLSVSSLFQPRVWGAALAVLSADPGLAAGQPEAALPASASASAPRRPMSMDDLREKLAEKLGATRAPGSPTPYVVRVENKTEGEAKAPSARKSAAKPAHKSAPAHAPANEPPAPAVHGDHPPHWSYDGLEGPQAWARLAPEYAQCASGHRQSPVDIRDGIPVQLPPIQFDYRPSGFSVLDNGHTIQVTPEAGNSIVVNGRRYELVQFHFHKPSEERLNGRVFDMVVHLVHRDAEGHLAVVAVLLQRGDAPQPQVQAVWNALPLERGDSLASPVPIDLPALLPQDARYLTYMGSLTTPPCTEGVLWLVMKQPVTVSSAQIDIFARLYPMNARPVQPLSGRLIKDGQ